MGTNFVPFLGAHSQGPKFEIKDSETSIYQPYF